MCDKYFLTYDVFSLFLTGRFSATQAISMHFSQSKSTKCKFFFKLNLILKLLLNLTLILKLKLNLILNLTMNIELDIEIEFDIKFDYDIELDTECPI